MLYGTTYYWRVRVYNATDTSGWSSTWRFTTSYQLTTAPVLTAPANDTVGIPYNSNLVFSWLPIDNIQGYYYQISTSSDHLTLTVGIDNWAENSVIIYPNPTQGKSFYGHHLRSAAQCVLEQHPE